VLGCAARPGSQLATCAAGLAWASFRRKRRTISDSWAWGLQMSAASPAAPSPAGQQRRRQRLGCLCRSTMPVAADERHRTCCDGCSRGSQPAAAGPPVDSRALPSTADAGEGSLPPSASSASGSGHCAGDCGGGRCTRLGSRGRVDHCSCGGGAPWQASGEDAGRHGTAGQTWTRHV
jgi:hypothetical protein